MLVLNLREHSTAGSYSENTLLLTLTPRTLYCYHSENTLLLSLREHYTADSHSENTLLLTLTPRTIYCVISPKAHQVTVRVTHQPHIKSQCE